MCALTESVASVRVVERMPEAGAKHDICLIRANSLVLPRGAADRSPLLRRPSWLLSRGHLFGDTAAAMSNMRDTCLTLAAWALLAGCAPASAPGSKVGPAAIPQVAPKTPAIASATAPAASTGPQRYVPEDAQAHALLLQRWSEDAALMNPLTQTIATTPEPRPSWSASLRKKALPLDPAGTYEVVGYTYNYGRFAGQSERYRQACDDRLLGPDGAYCDSVQRKRFTLDAVQARELIAIVSDPSSVDHHITLRCGFDPHHAFLVTDGANLVREIEVCFECGLVLVRPSADGKEPDTTTLTAAGYERFRVLCRDSGLPGCPLDKPMEVRLANDAKAYAESEEGNARRVVWSDPGDPGVDHRLGLRELDAEERRRMCLWFGAKHKTTAFGTKLGSNYECVDGHKFRTLELQACLKDFPESGAPGLATVGETIACFGDGPFDPAILCEPLHGQKSDRCADIVENGLGIAPSP